MAESSKIAWTHSTFNPWIGCSKVHEGCAHCYAEGLAKRTGKAIWGPSGTRSKTSERNWKEPLKWNREAEADGERRRVFCASLADVFEDWCGDVLDHRGIRLCVNDSGEVYAEGIPAELPNGDDWGQRSLTLDDLRKSLFNLIDATPNLDWLVLTKRPENIGRMIEAASTGYNYNHEQSGRAIRLSSGPGWGIGDRQRRSNLEGQEEDIRPLDRRYKDDALQESAGGNGKRNWLSASEADEGRQSRLRSGAPSGVDALQWSDTGRLDGEPQVRRQERQPPGSIGVGDSERAAHSRDRSSQCESEQAKGIEAPQNTPNRGRCFEHPATAGRGRVGNSPGSGVQDEAQGRERDRQSSHLDAYIGRLYRPNLWLGTSISDQATADEWLPRLFLSRDLSPVLFASVEPLIGPIDLSKYLGGLNWVIVGGEGGPKSRPCNSEWIRSIVRQCKAANTPCFVKQMGSNAQCHVGEREQWMGDGSAIELHTIGDTTLLELCHKKGGNVDEWPSDLRVREFPTVKAV